jgi:hypothetical protein
MTARPSGRKAQIVPVRSQPRLFLLTLGDLSSANFQSVPIDQKSLQRINKISLAFDSSAIPEHGQDRAFNRPSPEKSKLISAPKALNPALFP